MSPTRQVLVFSTVLAASAAALGSVVSCSSSSSSNAPGSDAKSYFAANVYPAIAPTCASCHATGDHGAPIILSSNADGSYNAIAGTPGLIAPPESSPLVQKGIHTGPALTSDQNTAVTTWLKMEIKARGIIGTGAPANLQIAFKQFGACMDYARWTQLALNTIAAQTTDNNQGQCMSCHNHGQASNWLSANAGDTFDHFTQFPYVQRLVVGTVDSKGAFAGLQASRRLIEKGIEERQPNANSHPTFTLSSALTNGLDQFVAETISNMNAQACTMVTHPDGGADGGDGGP